MGRAASERALVLLVGAVQCVNILDFVIMMPLAPDLSRDLAIPPEHLGFITGSYTAAAAVAGLVSSLFLERFDRKRALVMSMFGLVAGTLACANATSFASLVGARVLAGAFGGPATAIAFAIIADAIPVERRGQAVGAVMAAFSVAAVLGVPAGLELSRLGGWSLAITAVAALGLVVTLGAIVLMPPMRGHLSLRAEQSTYGELLGRPLVRWSYAMTATLMIAGFTVIVNMPAFVQFNLGYPRDKFGTLYLMGGVVSFITMRTAGKLVDRFGSFRVGSVGSALLALVMLVYFVAQERAAPVELLYVGLMLAMGLRNVSMQTLASRVPLEHERARFMALQSSVAHASSALGAFGAAQLLDTTATGALIGMEWVGAVALTLTAVGPFLMRTVERGVGRAATPHRV